MDCRRLIDRHYGAHPQLHALFMRHASAVARHAVNVAERLNVPVDVSFVHGAAMLHDIGIIHTRSPALGCMGKAPYIRHGIIGRWMLESEGFAEHALVCERHIGVGLSREDIRRQRLPLPLRDMRPQIIEQQIVCYADKFYSKNGGRNGRRKPIPQILIKLARYGTDKGKIFCGWVRRFEPHRAAEIEPSCTEATPDRDLSYQPQVK